MQSFPECAPCILRQAEHIVEHWVKSPQRQKWVVQKIAQLLERFDITQYTPPEATERVHKKLKRLIGVNDLYARLKKESNLFALKLYPFLKETVCSSKDPLLTAVRLSIAGNIIDYGAHRDFDVEKTIKKVLRQRFCRSDYARFKRKLKRAGTILYIADNAGEIVFDRVLIEELVKFAAVTCAVKSKPVLNDALIEDAQFVGLDKAAKIIPSGSTSAGTTWEQTTLEFRRIFKKADLVIAKGQGNLETLDRVKKKIFFLLYMKCPFLARRHQVKKGDILFWFRG